MLITPGVLLAWQISAYEALGTGSRLIEPEHLLIGLCSLEKATSANLFVNGPPAVHAAAYEADILYKVLTDIQLDPTLLRRSIRRRARRDVLTQPNAVMHRSELSLVIFGSAAHLARPAAMSGLHLLAALMETPGTIVVSALNEYGVPAASVRHWALMANEISGISPYDLWMC